MNAAVSLAYLAGHHLASRARAKFFSYAVSGAFASFGRKSVLNPPIRLQGQRRISIGEDVFVGAGSWLQTLPNHDSCETALVIGDRTGIAGSCVLSAAARIEIGRDVLLARNVYIADHSHRFDQVPLPVIAQGITPPAAVVIGDGAWLGQNVVVCPGVYIGRGAVIGANSVVKDDVPDYTVAVGSPARVVGPGSRGQGTWAPRAKMAPG